MRKKYSRIISKVKNLVKKACYSPANKFSPSIWKFHLQLVAKNALLLGRKLKADLEVLELAAYLHDYSAFVDIKNYQEHHLRSAEMAKEILAKLNFSEEKIKKVEECIICHRGSVVRPKKSLEAKILASADAMSHFYYIPDMFFLAYGVHKLESVAGALWLKNKLARSWKKIMPEGRALIKKDRALFLAIIKQVEE